MTTPKPTRPENIPEAPRLARPTRREDSRGIRRGRSLPNGSDGQPLTADAASQTLRDLGLTIVRPISANRVWLVEYLGRPAVAKVVDRIVAGVGNLLGDNPIPELTPSIANLTSGGLRVWLYPYYSLGSLRDQFEAIREAGSSGWVALLVQISSALDSLNSAGLAHGDVKPENILVSDLQRPTVALADFENALRVGNAGGQAIIREYTDGYQAPEVTSGVAGAASDYWSLGLIATELALGQNPLDGLAREAQNRMLSTDWAPPSERIENEHIRAFVLGCAARDPLLRWSHREVRLWAEGDRQTVVSALERSRQRVAVQTFTIGNRTFSTARGLADALLAEWFAGVAAIADDRLEQWISNDLRVDSLASELGRLKADASQTDETRLLRLAHFIGPEQALSWRGQELSRTALDAVLARAMDGDEAQAAWLQSFIDNRVPETLALLGQPEMLDGFRRFLSAWESYQGGWNRIVAAGAPPEVQLEPTRARAAVYRIVTNRSIHDAVWQRLQSELQTTPPLLRERWFFALGNEPQRLAAELQLILDRLEPLSILETVNDAAALLANQPRRVLYRPYDRILTRGMVLNAATMTELVEGPRRTQSGQEEARFRVRHADLAMQPAAGADAVGLAKQVLISWEGPENSRIQLAFGGTFLRIPFRRFRYRDLPSRGSVLVTITETTDFWIVIQRRWRFQVISGRLRVEVPRQDRLREPSARLADVGISLAAPSQALRPAADRMVNAHTRLLMPRALVQLIRPLHHVKDRLENSKELLKPSGLISRRRARSE